MPGYHPASERICLTFFVYNYTIDALNYHRLRMLQKKIRCYADGFLFDTMQVIYKEGRGLVLGLHQL